MNFAYSLATNNWVFQTMTWRPLVLFILILLLCPFRATAQNFADFEDFLRQYEAARPESRRELARSFVDWQQARGGFPVRQADGKVVFLYFAEERDVRLTGDFRANSFSDVYWDKTGEPMSRVGSIFYSRHVFEPDARLDYKFLVDGKDIRDPLNLRTLISGTGGGEVSELVMPRHQPSVLEESPIGFQRGTLHPLEEAWALPRVTVYLPPGYDPSRSYPTIYTADGTAWLDNIRFPEILDRLIAKRAIEPVIAVMIDSAADRSSWYSYNPDYLTYLRRVVEHIDNLYSTRRQPEARLHAGTSAGGRATMYVGLELPDLFKKLSMLSPSFIGPLYYFEPYFSGRKRPDRKLSIWMSAGTYEGSIYRDAQSMEAYCRSTDIPIKTVYTHQGHSFGAWRESAAEMLLYFFPSN
jgi:enterochelin esterase family protein